MPVAAPLPAYHGEVIDLTVDSDEEEEGAEVLVTENEVDAFLPATASLSSSLISQLISSDAELDEGESEDPPSSLLLPVDTQDLGNIVDQVNNEEEDGLEVDLIAQIIDAADTDEEVESDDDDDTVILTPSQQSVMGGGGGQKRLREQTSPAPNPQKILRLIPPTSPKAAAEARADNTNNPQAAADMPMDVDPFMGYAARVVQCRRHNAGPRTQIAIIPPRPQPAIMVSSDEDEDE